MKLNEALKFVSNKFGHLSPIEKIVLLTFISLMESSGEDFVKVGSLTMSKNCQFSTRSFQRIASDLKTKGVISWEHSNRKDGGKDCNTYRVTGYEKREECENKSSGI